MLHEYTHFLKMISPPLTGETLDTAYGARESRDLDRVTALLNADSYTWFATELLWTIVCNREFEDPTDEDGHDPNCNNGVCQG